MARRSSSSRSSAPKRSSVPSKPTTSVPATTTQRQPGMFAQMAATAGSVAVGSTIGHVVGGGISNMLFGGRNNDHSSVEQPQQQQQQVQQNYCESDQKAFMKCLESNSNEIGACQFYLDQFKQCQQQQQFQ
jgi:coiled-coil-helix-coiled-coil-helix domain-containing protein 2